MQPFSIGVLYYLPIDVRFQMCLISSTYLYIYVLCRWPLCVCVSAHSIVRSSISLSLEKRIAHAIKIFLRRIRCSFRLNVEYLCDLPVSVFENVHSSQVADRTNVSVAVHLFHLMMGLGGVAAHSQPRFLFNVEYSFLFLFTIFSVFFL